MFGRISVWRNGLREKLRGIFIDVVIGMMLAVIIAVCVACRTPDNKEENSVENNTETGTIAEEEKEEEDPQNGTDGNMTSQEGASVDISQVTENVNETSELTLGIDVAKYQGTIDWEKVAASGVDFAMIRVGYRTLKTGEIVADSNAKYNMQEASKYGIKIGVYFFSTAITKEEAISEANWVADYIGGYPITYPVVYNCEGFEDSENRQYSLTKTERTDFAMAFLNHIAERGYTPMFYAGKSELEGNAKWETTRIEEKYKIWVAQYPAEAYPKTQESSYSGAHDMWQYTNNGNVPGISKPVDLNVAYFGFKNTTGAQNNEGTEEVTANVEALMNFKEVNESVTAKERTNLRDIPSQGSDSNVMYTLSNGEVATRTGISDSGWSRVVFNGKTYYAVSSYLTTDLNYQIPTTEMSESESGSGIKTQFTSVDEWVTAKDAVNLRTLPSVTNEDSEVVVQIVRGDVIRRIGINTEVGWSKVEYNGQTLYCVSSYLMPAEESETEKGTEAEDSGKESIG